MDYASLIVEFGARYGIEGLAADENGIAGFEADGRTVVLQKLPETEAVVATVDVGAGVESGAAVVNRLLMTANQALYAADGMAVVQQLENGPYRLMYRFDVAGLDFVGFDAKMGRFLDLAEKWSAFLEKFAPIAADVEVKGADAVAATPAPDFPLAGDMMRV